jgi:hypothetical protein
MYILTNSVLESEIGRSPRIASSDFHLYPENELINSYLGSLKNQRFEGTLALKGSFTMSHFAKRTDCLNAIGGHLYVSEKLLQILLDSNIENYQYFEVDVIHRKKHYAYYLFYIYGQNYELVDYKNMVFWGESDPPYRHYYSDAPIESTKKREIKVESPEQLINWYNLYPEYPNLRYENLKLNYTQIHHDMIRLSLVAGDYFVSEKLRDRIIEQKCTGLAFRTKDWQEKDIL